MGDLIQTSLWPDGIKFTDAVTRDQFGRRYPRPETYVPRQCGGGYEPKNYDRPRHYRKRMAEIANTKWSEAEVEILKKHYFNNMRISGIAEILARTTCSVTMKIKKMKLTKKPKGKDKKNG